MIMLPITLTIAGAAALLGIWIASRVGTLRRRHKVLIGDGGHTDLAARMRAHANFAEYAPIFLILLGLVELARGSHPLLWGAGIVFILGRILHVFGMDRQTNNALRAAGIWMTVISLIGLALYAIALPYLVRMAGPTITYAEVLASTASATNGFDLRS
jgi:uncharacterized membrane protein YecN with MAPEG domain